MPHRGAGGRGGKAGSKIPKPGSNGKDGDDAKGHDPDSGDNDVIESTGVAKILAVIGSLKSDMQEFKQEVRGDIHSVNFSATEQKDKFAALEVKAEEDRATVRETTEATAGLKTRTAVHGLRLNELDERIERLEREKRRNLIVIEGVIEEADKPSPVIIEELFQDLKVDLDTLVCDRIYRRGKEAPVISDRNRPEDVDPNKARRRTERPRPIVVGFKEHDDKVKIYRHLKNLKGIDRWDRVYVNDDLTEMQVNQVRDLRSLSAYARSTGQISTVRATFIWVAGKRYSYEEVHKLAPELTFEKAKTISCLGGEGIAFQSTHAPLSNLYPVTSSIRAKSSCQVRGHYTTQELCSANDT